eukprot:121888_1
MINEDHTSSVKILPDDKANNIPFSYVCKTFSNIQRAKGLDKVYQALNADVKRKLQGQSSYPYIRLLLPGLDRERQVYGVGAKLYSKLICKVENLPQKDIEAIRHWTDSDMNTTGKCGDLPSTVETILSSRKGSEFSYKTVGDVNRLLDDLAKADENEKTLQIIRRISGTFSPVEHKWIMRIIFKDLRIGCGEKNILKFLHQDAEKAYYQWMDLRKLCSVFINLKTSERISSDVKLGYPFVPMLSARVPMTGIIKLEKFKSLPFVMEIKIDGERMLCHKMGNEVVWFTRRGNCYNEYYGDVLNPLILSCIDAHTVILDGEIVSWDEDNGCVVPFGTNKRTAVKEGGLYDNDDVRPIFGSNKSKLEGGTFLFYIVFDIVYLTGEGSEKTLNVSVNDSPIGYKGNVKPGSLMGLPLDIRRRVLRNVMTEKRHRMEFAKDLELWDGNTSERQMKLEEFFTEMTILQQEEGIIVKSLESTYSLGEMGRETKDWIKLKPDYSDQTPSLDCLIVGAYFSESKEESKRSGLISSFLLAILQKGGEEEETPTSSPSAAAPTFLTCGKVGSGLAIDELKSLTIQLERNWTKRKPGNVRGKETADRWIPHDQSIVLEVKCFDIVDSNKAGAKWVMRFPRVKLIRRDKLWKDVDTVESVHQIRLGKRKWINKEVDYVIEEDEYSTKRKRRKRNNKKDFGGRGGGRLKMGDVTIADGFGLALMDEIDVNSNLLVVRGEDGIATRSLKICVYSGKFVAENGVEWEKVKLQRLIHELGGQNRVNPVNECDYVLVGSQDDLRTPNIISHVIEGNINVDVVDFRWLFQIEREKEYKAPTWGQHRAMCKDTKNIFKKFIDVYGDDYYDPVCAEELQRIMDRMPLPTSSNEPWQHMVLRTWNSEDMWVFDCKMNSLWHNPGKIYIDCYTTLGVEDSGKSDRIIDDDLSCLYLAISHVEKYGGVVEKWLSPQVTHVIVDDFLHKRVSKIKKRIRELAFTPYRQHTRVVTWGWVFACTDAGHIVDPPSGCLVNLSNY